MYDILYPNQHECMIILYKLDSLRIYTHTIHPTDEIQLRVQQVYNKVNLLYELKI